MKKVEAPCVFCGERKHGCASFVQSMRCEHKIEAEKDYRTRHSVKPTSLGEEAREEFIDGLDDD